METFDQIARKLLAGWERERALPAPSDPLTAGEGETKCGTKNQQMKELACNSDPYGLFLSSSNKKSVTLVMNVVLLLYSYVPTIISIEPYSMWSPFAF